MDKIQISNHNKRPKRVTSYTLGCRLNGAETGTLMKEFTKRGYEILPFGEKADVTLINTCTVTDKADATCRNIIRKAKKFSPEGKIIVVGCFAQLESEMLKTFDEVDLILGTTEKFKLFDYLDKMLLPSQIEKQVNVSECSDFFKASTLAGQDNTRAVLKIQDGCNYFCSYCIIPFARGRSRAVLISEAVQEAKKLVSEGFKEIVLTGINVGDFINPKNEKLEQLVKEILDVEGLKRLRISSIEPNTVTDNLLEVLKASPKFLDYFHLPLQSGDDSILKSMGRRYTANDFRQVVTKIKKHFPNAGIGTDIIVGHPGESDLHFQNTYNLLNELPVTHFHVFPFSRRKGTRAFELEDNVPSTVKRARVNDLIKLGESKLHNFSNEMVGRENSILFERRKKSGKCFGYTTNFLRISINSNTDLHNFIKKVKITCLDSGSLIGELTE